MSELDPFTRQTAASLGLLYLNGMTPEVLAQAHREAEQAAALAKKGEI